MKQSLKKYLPIIAAALLSTLAVQANATLLITEVAPWASASFLSSWFGASAPVGLQIGNYTGTGVGLSTTADAVNIFDAAGVLQANVSFAASDAIAPFQTFDNVARLNNTAISTLSVAGVNGAFAAVTGSQVGSPSTIAAAVPEPETYAMFLASLGLMGFISHKRQG